MASTAPSDLAVKVSVIFESRADGGLRAYSDDVPGFVLSNPCCDVVLSGVEPTLETILSHMFETRMRVTLLRDLQEIRDGLKEIGMIPDFQHSKREYVSQPALA